METSGLVYDYSTNNVGIGTAAPGAKLEIIGANDTPLIKIGSVASTEQFNFTRSAATGALSIQGDQSGFRNILLAPSGGNVGIGTTSPYQTLSVAGKAIITDNITSSYFTATSTTATSTFPYLSVTTNSNLGTVVGGTWQGTAIGATYGGTGINSVALTGIAQIVAGTWSASSTLSTAFGGTGWNSIQANSVLLGNGAGRLSTTTAGTDGFTLALAGGVPTWVATSTLSTITGTLAVAKGGTARLLSAKAG